MDDIISEFEKDQSHRVLASISDFKGKKRIDIRVWYKDDSDEELKPSKQGVNLPVERFKDLKKLMTDLENALKEKKLL